MCPNIRCDMYCINFFWTKQGLRNQNSVAKDGGIVRPVLLTHLSSCETIKSRSSSHMQQQCRLPMSWTPMPCQQQSFEQRREPTPSDPQQEAAGVCPRPAANSEGVARCIRGEKAANRGFNGEDNGCEMVNFKRHDLSMVLKY